MRRLMLLLFVACAGALGADQGADDPNQKLLEIKAAARSIPAQAQALVDLAWPAEGPPDPQLASLAREDLIRFGAQGMDALRRAILRAPRRFQADVVATLMEARFKIVGAEPGSYLPALEQAVWYGTTAARRLAIPELTRYRYPPALLTILDAAYESPQLRGMVIDAMGTYDNDKARHFLAEVLADGTPVERRQAAWALARIGDRAQDTLLEATRSEDPLSRVTAMRVVIPLAGLDELSQLYDYAARHPDDDPQVMHWLRQRARYLERVLESRQALESE